MKNIKLIKPMDTNTLGKWICYQIDCSCGKFIIWDDEEPIASYTYCGQSGQKQDLSEV